MKSDGRDHAKDDGGLLAKCAAGVRAEWASYHPKGPPHTYINEDPMSPEDAMLHGILTMLTWIISIPVVGILIYLIVVLIQNL